MKEIPESILALRINPALYEKVKGAESFPNPMETLLFALSKASPDGVALEFGVFSGKTLSVITQHFPLKSFGFDSFEGLPEDWRDGFPKGTFAMSGFPIVHGAIIFIGWFQDTLNKFKDEYNQKISFIHLDADLYSSTKYVLNGLNERIEPGCILLFDEFMNYEGFEEHEYRAFNEWCSEFSRVCIPIAYTSTHEQMAFLVQE